VAEHDMKKCVMEDVIWGRKQEGRRFSYHVICIGEQDATTYSSITSQKIRGSKKMAVHPPWVSLLCLMQRSFVCNSQELTEDTIVDHDEVF